MTLWIGYGHAVNTQLKHGYNLCSVNAWAKDLCSVAQIQELAECSMFSVNWYTQYVALLNIDDTHSTPDQSTACSVG